MVECIRFIEKASLFIVVSDVVVSVFAGRVPPTDLSFDVSVGEFIISLSFVRGSCIGLVFLVSGFAREVERFWIEGVVGSKMVHFFWLKN